MYETCLIRQWGQEGADWQEGQKRRQRMRKEVLKKFVSGKEEEGIGIYLGREKLKRWWKWGRWSWFYSPFRRASEKVLMTPVLDLKRLVRRILRALLNDLEEWRCAAIETQTPMNRLNVSCILTFLLISIYITCLINCLTHI